MAKGRADIANFAVRTFLQEVGQAYDTMRGFTPYRRNPDLGEVLSFFDNSCCYCGESLTPLTAAEDHLVGINKSAMGLHAWGNVVPSCSPCNGKKHGKDWRDFLMVTVGPEDYMQRVERIQAFQKHYKYKPHLGSEIKEVADALYEEVGALAMKLVELKVARAEDRIRAIHRS